LKIKYEDSSVGYLLALGFGDLAVLKDLAAILIDNGVSQAVTVVEGLEICAAWEHQRLMDAPSA